MTIKKIIKKIKTSKTFLITSHMNVEGDALGSTLAMYILLRHLKKKVYVYLNDRLPYVYKFLPFSKVIKNTFIPRYFDAAVVLDCSDSSRAGRVKDSFSYAKCIINIDHHISNTSFGDLNWVDPKASSVCQMLYRLCKRMGIIDRNIARCLYTGISTDTGNFTYSISNSETHRTIASLVKYNIKPNKIYENIHSACSADDIKFISGLMNTIKLDPSKKICWITASNWKEKDFDLTEVIFSILRLIKDVEVFLIFKKVAHGKVRVNFRSRHYVDVNRIAKFFGGGGHKRASGTTIDGSLSNVEKNVISFVRRCVNHSSGK